MATIKNPNYNPNDPKSLRYIQAPDPLMSVPVNQSKAPNMSTNTPIQSTPKPVPPTNVALPPLDFSNPTQKTSTPSNIKPLPTVQNVNQSAGMSKAPATNMSVAPNMTAKPTGGSYTIRGGDSLSKIAAANGTSIAEIMKLNPQIKNPNLIIAGQSLNLPGKAPNTAIPTQTPPQTNFSAGTPAPAPTYTPPAQTGQQPTGQQGGTISNTEQGTNPPPAPTGNQVTDKAMQDLAKEAAKAGMKLEDYLDLVNRQGAIDKQQSDEIRNKLGIPDLVDDAFGKPKQTTVDMYRELYEMSDLKSVKESVKKLDEEIAQKRADLVTATGELMNNPWISQATRSGRLGNLQRIALADIQNSIDQKQQYLDLYDQGVGEIEESIKRSVFDQDLDRDLTVDKLNYLLTEAERDEKFVERTLEQRALRYAPDFFENMPQEGAEGFTLSEGQARYDSEGNLIASRGSQSSGGKLVTINGINYIQNADGSFSLPNLPQAPVNEATVQTLDDKLDLIDSILNNEDLDAMVGPYAINRISGPASIEGRQKAAADINRLVDKETLDTLLQLKAQGGSLGAVSEKELAILQNAATNFKNWEIKDENGNGTGRYAVSEEAFKAELNRIRESTLRLREAAGGNARITSVDELYKYSTPERKQEIKALIRDGFTDEEILSSFNKESQTSLKGANELTKIAEAIGQFETGGDYNKRGVVVTSGRYKGERALGKYQIMPGNLPQWSKEALGYQVSEQEFMRNPQIQDAIAQYKMAKIFEQYGTLEDVASVWFSGQPVARAGNRKDDLGTSVPSYVRNVRSIYNNFG